MIPKITLWRRGTKEVRPAIPGLAGQKGQREQEETMLEWLKTILGDQYTEEIDKKVSDEIGKGLPYPTR